HLCDPRVRRRALRSVAWGGRWGFPNLTRVPRGVSRTEGENIGARGRVRAPEDDDPILNGYGRRVSERLRKRTDLADASVHRIDFENLAKGCPGRVPAADEIQVCFQSHERRMGDRPR